MTFNAFDYLEKIYVFINLVKNNNEMVKKGKYKLFSYFIENTKLRNKILTTLQPLKSCIPCIIHEDIHPGNIIVSKNNKIKLIDCEWVHPGLNKLSDI